jgi:hypothetical protein
MLPLPKGGKGGFVLIRLWTPCFIIPPLNGGLRGIIDGISQSFRQMLEKEVAYYTTGENRWEDFIIVLLRTHVELRADFRYLYWVDKLRFSSDLQPE